MGEIFTSLKDHTNNKETVFQVISELQPPFVGWGGQDLKRKLREKNKMGTSTQP